MFAILNRTPGLSDTEVAFWAEGCNQQARELAAAQGVEYTPVVFLAEADDLPSDARVLTILPSIDAPGALGYHDLDASRVIAEVKYTGPDTSITVSHEICEAMFDPLCNRWMPFDDNHEQAGEVSDRVEGDSYAQDATVSGETRPVKVSNYLLPSAFDPTGKAPFDRLGKLFTWNDMSPGGYVILRDITTGKVGNVFASFATDDKVAEETVRRKRENPLSRVSRRSGGPLPGVAADYARIRQALVAKGFTSIEFFNSDGVCGVKAVKNGSPYEFSVRGDEATFLRQAMNAI